MSRKEAYFLLISTFALILVWIIFSILQSAFSSTISEPISVQISPINATFDTKTIAELKKRTIVIPAAEILTETATEAAQDTSPTPIPTITNTPASSTSGQTL